jgi:hypothetical protein
VNPVRSSSAVSEEARASGEPFPSLPPAVPEELLGAIRARSRTVHARGRVAEALYSLALDICGDAAELSAVDRQWLLEALAGPVADAAQAALDTLTDELALAIRSAPPAIRPQIVVGPRVSRIDFE